MNEFERRLRDIVEMSSYIAKFADPGREILLIESYTYSIDAIGVNITSAAAQTFNLVMNSDSDFVVTGFAGGALINTGPTAPNGTRCVEFTPALLVQITDQSSGKTYFNRPTPLGLMAGAAGFPYLLASPRVIRPRVTLAVSAQGAVAGATYNNFYFSIHGAKIFYAGGSKS